MKRKKREYTKKERELARKNGKLGDIKLREKLGEEEYRRIKSEAGAKGRAVRWNKN
jgi:hypothetical protein